MDGTPIAGARNDEKLATDIMIHIGSTFSIFSYDYLGGSFGCFGFIPPENIHKTVDAAEKASINDDYDDNLSNKGWREVCSFITGLAFPHNREIQILLRERASSSNYTPTKILEE